MNNFSYELLAYPKAILLFSVALISCLWVGYVVLWKKNYHKKNYQIYTLYALLFMVWILTNAYFQSPLLNKFDKSVAVKMALLSNITVCLGGIAAFYFSCMLRTGVHGTKLWEKLFVTFVIAETLILNLIPNFTVTDVKIFGPAKFELTQGAFSPLFFSIAIAGIGLTFKNFLALRKEKLKIVQQKAYYMLSGATILLASALIFLIVVPLGFKNYDYAWVPPVFCLAEIVLFGYALLTTKFYSLKYQIQRTLLYTSHTALYFLPFYFTLGFLYKNGYSVPALAATATGYFSLYFFLGEKTLFILNKVWNYCVYKKPTNIVEELRALRPVFERSGEEGLHNLAKVLDAKKAELLIKGDKKFHAFASHLSPEYKCGLTREEVEYQAERYSGRKATALKKRMDRETIGFMFPVVNKLNELS